MRPAAETKPGRASVTPIAATAVPRTAVAEPPLSMRVDRLVLHGLPFARHDGTRIEQAFRHEMQRLVATGEVKFGSLGAQALHQLRLGELQLEGDATAEQLGRQLAVMLLRKIAP